MDLLANTSGPSLLVLMNRVTVVQHAPVLLEAEVEVVFPRLWARTTFVSQD